MQIVIELDDNLYARLFDNGVDNYDDAVDMAKAIRNGTPLPKGHDIETLLQRTTDEVFVQCKQFNESFSNDWNEGFNDGMFHTLTIIKGIIKADKEIEKKELNIDFFYFKKDICDFFNKNKDLINNGQIKFVEFKHEYFDVSDAIIIKY